jgi:hypothetical protein
LSYRPWPVALSLSRLAFGTLAVVAMTYQFAVLNVAPGYAKGNFFSFFTIQSNILAVAALFLLVAVPRDRRTALFDGARQAAVLYMAITGVVFALLLAGLQEDVQTSASWVDFVVHKLMPVVLVVDWVVDPPRHRLRAWTVLAWLAYPAAWLAYTLVRGEVVEWYPYPFVDVSNLGYGGVLARAAGLTVGFALGAAALLWLGNRRARE